MKRFFSLLTTLTLLLSLAACTSPQPAAPQTHSTSEESSAQTELSSSTESASTQVEPQELQEAYSYVDHDGTVRAIGIAAVTNDTQSPVKLPLCTMVFTDTAGKELFTAEDVSGYPEILAVGETGYYYEMVETDLTAQADLLLRVEAEKPEAFEGGARFETDKLRLADSPYGGLLISGEVTNTTQEEAGLVCIAAVLCDKEGKPLCVPSTILSEPLAAKKSAVFSIESYDLPPELSADDIGSYQLFAYPMQ